MEKNNEKYREGRKCRNIKYNIEETIVGYGLMKINGEWIESVTYKGICRFTSEEKMYTKQLSDFEKEFELL